MNHTKSSPMRILAASLVLAAAMAAGAARADTETAGGYEWTFRIVNGGAEIYKGGAQAAITPDPSGHVTIPATLGSYPVTSIGNSAFFRCSGMTEVVIPDSVTSIGAAAFYECAGLSKVVIGNGVTNIDETAFLDCYGIRNLTVPQYVCTNQVSDLFWDSTQSITNVVVSDGVASIGRLTFSDCRQLISVSLPQTLTSIGEMAFYNCKALAGIAIPDGVTDIGDSAFRFCEGLSFVTIPNSMTNIGNYAFDFVPSAGFYVSDIYGGPEVVGMEVGLSLSPGGGYVLNGSSVKCTASCTVPGAVVRVTKDGSEPTAESPVFATFTVHDAMVVRVGAFVDGVRVLQTRAEFWNALAETPTIAVEMLPDARTTQVTMTCPTEGATIRYTLDGEEPTEESAEYIGPFVMALVGGQSVTVKARAFLDGYGPSVVAEESFSREWTLESSVGDPGLVFKTANPEWVRDTTTGHSDGECLRSTASVNGDMSRLMAPNIRGSGRVSFWWKVSCEATDVSTPWDRVEFLVDGVRVAWLDGETGWQKVEWSVEGGAEEWHVLEWRYQKDDSGSAGQDCAWLDDVTWRPAGGTEYVTVNDNKGTVAEQDGGYFVTANEGETLEDIDILFTLDPDAYDVDVAAGGKSATVHLKKPEIGLRDGATGVLPDSDDPTGLLVIAPAAQMSAIPAAGSGQTVRALPVKAYPGFWYRASWGNALGGFTDGAKVQATGDALYLGVIRQEGQRGFYRLTVSEE